MTGGAVMGRTIGTTRPELWWVRIVEARMRRSQPVAVFCLAAIFCLWAGGARSADIVIGSVIALRGDVSLEAGTEHRALALRDPVRLADTIVSGAGKAKIALNDGSIISIGENSRLVLQEYRSVTNAMRTRLHLIEGVLRLFVNRAIAGGQFEIESETAVAAVRGTDFLIDAKAETTGVAVIDGIVMVSGRGPQAQSSVLLEKPGEGVDVPRGGPPGPVRPWSAQRFGTTLARATLE